MIIKLPMEPECVEMLHRQFYLMRNHMNVDEGDIIAI